MSVYYQAVLDRRISPDECRTRPAATALAEAAAKRRKDRG
jgi:hypothetical protein